MSKLWFNTPVTFLRLGQNCTNPTSQDNIGKRYIWEKGNILMINTTDSIAKNSLLRTFWSSARPQ